MTNDKLIEMLDQMHGRERALLINKGGDYSPGRDTLQCFKRIGAAYKLKPITVAAIFLEKHLDAIRTYINEGKVNTEALGERIGDARNYLAIIQAIDSEGA